MRRTAVAIAGVLGVLVVAGCTSEHGALPPPSASRSPMSTADGVAAAALLTTADLPAGYVEVESDVTDRWTELLDLSERAISLRPDCAAPFEAVSQRLGGIPTESDGVAFAEDDDDDVDEEIVQFVAALDDGVAEVIVGELADVNGRCDAYTLPSPEGGSLALSIQPLALDGLPEGDDVDVTVWERTLISSTLRRTETLAAYRAGDVAGLISVLGDGIGEDDALDDDGPDDDPDDDDDNDPDDNDPDDDDGDDRDEARAFAALITAAVERAQEAGR